jgi:hypothetical protein
MSERSAGFRILFMPAILVAMLTGIGGVRAEELTFDLKVERGRVANSMQLIRVKQGDVVRLRWSTDSALDLHLHGYDIEQKIVPGQVSELTFTARATGRFPVEVHTPKRGGGHSHGVPLVRIEVYPR